MCLQKTNKMQMYRHPRSNIIMNGFLAVSRFSHTPRIFLEMLFDGEPDHDLYSVAQPHFTGIVAIWTSAAI